MKNKFSRLSLRNQIVITLIISVLIFAIVNTTILIYEATKQTEQLYLSIVNSNLDTYNQLLEVTLQNIVDMQRSTVYDDMFLDQYRHNGEISTSSYSVIKKSLNQLMIDNPYISSAFIYDFDDNYVFSSTYYNSKTASAYREFGNQKQSDKEWYLNAIAANGKEIFIGYNPVLNSLDDFSICKEIINPNTLKPIGVIVISIKRNMFDRIPISINSCYRSFTFLIEDFSGENVLYSRVATTEQQDNYEEYIDAIASSDHYIKADKINNISGWRLTTYIDKSELITTRRYLQPALLSLIIGISLSVIFESVVVNNSIYKPIEKLKRAIARYNTDGKPLFDIFDDSEIGNVSTFVQKAVNHGIDLNQHILEQNKRELEMQIQVLQMQINPHFLYNTFDTLYLKAYMKGEQEIADMVSALAEMFRVTLNTGKNYICLATELKYIERYIYIQNIRFSGKILFQETIEPDVNIEECYLLKFLIQPFVENAIVHGFEPDEENFKIDLVINSDGGDLQITVRDNGMGMANPSDALKGFGVNNVKERIRLFYGEQYGVQFSGAWLEGTCVKINIPRCNLHVFEKPNS